MQNGTMQVDPPFLCMNPMALRSLRNLKQYYKKVKKDSLVNPSSKNFNTSSASDNCSDIILIIILTF